MPDSLIDRLKRPFPGAGLKFRGNESDPKAALILVHGRGATAESILQLVDYFHHPEMIYLAPQAAGNAWFPYPFMSPESQNEPWLSSAFQTLERLLIALEEGGIPAERVILGGFSQGACLVSEYCARNARRYGGLLVFSGGLIGSLESPRSYAGTLEGTPVLVGCGDRDAYIPLRRVQETAEVLESLGGEVDLQIYPGMGHTINEDEIERSQRMIEGVLEAIKR